MLAGYSLVQWEADNTAFSLHRLVADMTSRRIVPDQRVAWLHAAIAWVNDYLPVDPPPDNVRSWPLWEPLQGHLAALIETAVAEDINEPTARLASDLGFLLKTQGLWREAEPLMRRALAIDETSYGAEHPKVAIDLNNLALLLKATNRLEEAEPLMRRGLEIILRFCETNGYLHPDLQVYFENYTILLQQMGRTEALQHINALAKAFGLNLDSAD